MLGLPAIAIIIYGLRVYTRVTMRAFGVGTFHSLLVLDLEVRRLTRLL